MMKSIIQELKNVTRHHLTKKLTHGEENCPAQHYQTEGVKYLQEDNCQTQGDNNFFDISFQYEIEENFQIRNNN